jgi:hypothetical protein
MHGYQQAIKDLNDLVSKLSHAHMYSYIRTCMDIKQVIKDLDDLISKLNREDIKEYSKHFRTRDTTSTADGILKDLAEAWVCRKKDWASKAGVFEQEFSGLFDEFEMRQLSQSLDKVVMGYMVVMKARLKTHIPTGLSETDMIMADLLDKSHPQKLGHMKIIRVYLNINGAFFASFLRLCRVKLLGPRSYISQIPGSTPALPPFAVLEDFANSNVYEAVSGDQYTSFRLPGKVRKDLKDWETISARHSRLSAAKPRAANKKRQDQKLSLTQEGGKTGAPRSLQYNDIDGLPCILILCAKGRMGDTFPQSLDCLDMRIRASENTTTFIQEIGRLCRYPCTVPYREGNKCVTAMRYSEHNLDPRDTSLSDVLSFTGTHAHVGISHVENGADGNKSVPQPHESRMSAATTRKLSDLFAQGKCVVVLKSGMVDSPVKEQRFMGYATHMDPWDRSRAMPKVVHRASKCLVDLANGGTVLKYAGASHKYTWQEGDRLVIYNTEQLLKKTTLEYRKILREYVEIQGADVPGEYVCFEVDEKLPDIQGENISCSVLRDTWSLKVLMDQCLYGGSCHQVMHKIPYALVPDKTISAVQKAVKFSDAYGHEIWQCMELTKMDGYVKNANRYSRKITEINPIHNYRLSYRPSEPQKERGGGDEEQDGRKANYDIDNAQNEVHDRRLLLFAGMKMRLYMYACMHVEYLHSAHS